jgi:hypothetical protein
MVHVSVNCMPYQLRVLLLVQCRACGVVTMARLVARWPHSLSTHSTYKRLRRSCTNQPYQQHDTDMRCWT